MLLEFLFGWRKASKCKKLIRCVRDRLKPLRNKREVLVRQSREDIAQILKNGQHPSTAFSRVKQLFKDESMLAAYDLLDHFCEFIIINLPYIRRNRDCPNDINEAVSSLIFAAARCADLPELQVLRKLFGERYGKDFVVTAVELFPGNHVNRQISENLSVKSISDDVKLMLLEEIYLDYNLQEQVDALTARKSDSGWEKEASGRDIQVVYNDIDQVRMHASNAKEISQMNHQKHTKHGESILEEACLYDSSSNWKKLIGNLSGSSRSSDIINHFQPNKQGENERKDERWISKEVSDFGNHNCSNKCTDLREPHDGISRLSSGPYRKRRKSSGQKSQKRSISGKSQLSNSCIENNDLRHDHSTSRRILSRNIHQRRHHSSTSISLEMKDLESTIYYNGASDCSDVEYPKIHWKSNAYKRTKPNGTQSRNERSHGNGRRLIHDKKNSKISSEESGKHSIRAPENMPSHRCKYNGRRSDTSGSVGIDCCLDHPCYFLATDVDEVIEKSTSVKQTSNNIREGKSVQVSSIWDSNSDTDPDRNTSTRTISRYSVASHSQEPDREGNNHEVKLQKCGQPQKMPPYFRTMSMPIERSKITLMNETMRSASFGHVHPKLPDYDDLTTKFTALKKEHCNRTTCVSTNA